MRIREELRAEADRNHGLLATLVAKMETYFQAEGGAKVPLPEV